jgi:hypothetical protein
LKAGGGSALARGAIFFVAFAVVVHHLWNRVLIFHYPAKEVSA